MGIYNRLIAALLVVVLLAVNADAVTFMRRGGVVDDTVAATDWRSSLLALWTFGEASGDFLDSGGGSVTDDLDIGGVTRTETPVPPGGLNGGKNARFLDADNDIAVCDATNACSDLSFSANDSTDPMTLVGWAYVDGNNSNAEIWDNYASTAGWEIWRNRVSASEEGRLHCKFGNGTTGTTAQTADGSFAQNVWVAWLCKFDGANVVAYVAEQSDGEYAQADARANWDNGTETPTSAWIGSTGGATSDFGDGYMFEVAADNAAWTISEWRRWVACRADGDLCACDATTPANYKSCTTNADCQNGTTPEAICYTREATDVCAGPDMGFNFQGSAGANLAACNAAAP